MRRLCQGKYQSGICPKSRVCSDERDTSHSARANVLIGFRRIGFVFVFRGGVCCRVPRGDAVRNAPVRDKGVLSFNQRRSIIAKQNQCSEESKNENNGLPRNKYQHELTSGGVRATCDSLPFYRRMLLQRTLKMRTPFVRSANLLCKTDVFA